MKRIAAAAVVSSVLCSPAGAANPTKEFRTAAQKAADELLAAGEPMDRCSLGVQFGDGGIVLRRINDTAQLSPGDIVETIDGTSLANKAAPDVVAVLRNKPPAATVGLNVKRDGKTIPIEASCLNSKSFIQPQLAAYQAAAKGDFKGCLNSIAGHQNLGAVYWYLQGRCTLASKKKLDPAEDAQFTFDWMTAVIEDARYAPKQQPNVVRSLHQMEGSFRSAGMSHLYDRLVAATRLWPGTGAQAYNSSVPNWAKFRLTAEKAVRDRLVDPASAQFEWPFGFIYGTWKPFLQGRFTGYWTCGQVNARNRMGGYTGSSPFAVVMTDENNVSWVEIATTEKYDFTAASCAKSVKMLPLAPPEMQQAASASGPPGSIADELAKLAALRDKGIITHEEFEAQKAKLLSGN